MKKTHSTVEELLTSGKDTGLSASEHSEMWGSLKTYAEYHQPKVTVTATRSNWWTHTLKWSSAVVSVMVLSVVGTGYAAQGSLPGELLYTMKVEVVEPAIGFSHFSEAEQLAYQATLLERRLVEMQTLSEGEQLTEETMVAIETKVEEHGQEISKLIEGDTAEVIAAETKLDVLSSMVTTLQTQEYIESGIGKNRPSKVKETKVSISTLFNEEVEDFASEEPAAAVSYIAETVDELDGAFDEISTSTEEEVVEYLEEVETALTEGDVDQALQSVGEAQQLIELRKNIENVLDDTRSE